MSFFGVSFSDDQFDVAIAAVTDIDQRRDALRNLCTDIGNQIADAHRSRIATLYGLNDNLDPGLVEVHQDGDECIVALSEETALYLARYLDDANYDPQAPDIIKVGLPGDGTGRRIDQSEVDELLQRADTFERPLTGADPRVAHLPAGVFQRSSDNQTGLLMLVAYLEPREVDHYHFGNLSTITAAQAFPAAVEEWFG